MFGKRDVLKTQSVWLWLEQVIQGLGLRGMEARFLPSMIFFNTA